MQGARKAAVLAAAGLASVALSLAGCGGSSSPTVAHLPSAKGASSASSEGASSSLESTASSQQKMVAFARCVRSHGVPDFSEPVEGHMTDDLGSAQNPGSPQFQAAKQQCRKLLPSAGTVSPQMQKQLEERALMFAACMRSHGEPNFPAPEFSTGGGGFHVTISGPRSGIDPNSPQFNAARKACRQYFGPPGSKGSPAAVSPGGAGEQSRQTVAP